MTASQHIALRRTGLALMAALVTALFTGSALAQDRPASSFYTPQQLEAMSSSWAAKGRLLGNVPAADWAARAHQVGNRDAASFYTRDQLRAMSSNWAAKGR